MVDPRSQFGPVAERYLSSGVHANPTALHQLVQLVRPNGGVAIDVATGGGNVAYALAPYLERIVATDITPEMLDVTKKAAASKGLTNLDVLFAEAESLPFRSQSLDGVACRLGAHHFRSVKAFVSESARVLKPGGWFLLVDNAGIEDAAADDQLDALERLRDPSHVRCYRPSMWHEMIRSAGFEVSHEEVARKRMDAADWMVRMRVSEPNQKLLMDAFRNAVGELANYLAPAVEDGRMRFDFGELTILARRI